ncbi:hypothetical protein LJR225_001930 [Phenylobacterium sp. LjRoot225]|uniref:hypothetical protein n=1 Tax=Phenylobacterium sp. LjRoot225 TaxID=3342285 RepID=UPI003ECD2F79
MIILQTLLAVLLATAASVMLYLAAPNQRLLARRPAAPTLVRGGGVSLVAALALLLRVAGPAVAVFALMTLTMTVLQALPFLAVLRRRSDRP